MIALWILVLLTSGVYSCVGLQCYNCIGSSSGTFDNNNRHCQQFEASEIDKRQAPPGGVCTQILLDCVQEGEHTVTLVARSVALPGTTCTPDFRARVEFLVQETLRAAGQELDSAVVKECEICDKKLCNNKTY